jgi:peptide/nickel transport system substrate-binding protein
LSEEKKIDRRGYMKYAAAGIVIVAGAGAGAYYATRPTMPPTTTTPTTTTQKDTLIVGTTDSIETSLDPAEVWDFFGASMIYNLGAPLVYIKPGSSAGPNDYVPALATSWTTSEDGLAWTFQLRQGVKFADGESFTSESVKYSFERNIGLAMPDGPQLGLGYGDMIASVEAPSEYTVVFNLKAPFAPFLALLAFSGSFIVNPKYAPYTPGEAVQYTEGDARVSNPNDLGPYLLSEWTRKAGKDYQMKLDANPNYFGAADGYPRAKHIIIKMYSDSTALALAMKSGDIDMAFRQLSATDIKDMQSNPSLKVWEGTGAFIQYICFQEAISPFNDPRARRAIAAALDRREIVDTVFLGQGIPLYSQIPNGMSYHEDSFKELGDANFQLTESLLQELGYSTEKKLVLDWWYESSGHYPQSADLAAVFKAQLERTGLIKVNLHAADWPSYKTNRDAKSMQVYVYGWYPDYVDPDNYVQPFFDSVGGSWLGMGYNNPKMDELIKEARSITDPVRRGELYSQIQKIMVEDCPIVPVYQGTAWAVTKPDVTGVNLDITQNMYYWLITPGR